jgi:hypothetical protein
MHASSTGRPENTGGKQRAAGIDSFKPCSFCKLGFAGWAAQRVIHKQTPSTVFRPGANRQFQFPEWTDLPDAVKLALRVSK